MIKSMLQIIPVLFLISVIVFVLVYVTGDPVSLMLADTATDEDREILIAALGLDQPLHVQYFTFI
ncbi:ABC transporter permease, partial [Klebsiella pneumoniae]|nr:ABC transporter permease [Klebsiella pneumoniae]